MGKKWGSNEDIYVGDIFRCNDTGMLFSGRPEYYQMVALRGKRIRITGEEVTAWVYPERRPDGTPWLLEVGPGGWRLGYCYEPEQPEDWKPWDLETAKRLEAERYAEEATLFGEADGQP